MGLHAPESQCRKAKRTAFHRLFGALCTPSRHSASRSSRKCLLPAPAFLAAGYRCALVGPLLFWATGSGEEIEEANQQVSDRSGRHVAGVSDLRSAHRRLRDEGDWCASAWGRNVWVCAREVVLGKRFRP